MKLFTNILKVILAVMMGLVTIITFYQIIMRFVFNNASSWSEELVRFIFVWTCFIAAGLGIREHAHVGIDVLVNAFPAKLRKVASISVYTVIAVFGGYLLYASQGVLKSTGMQKSSVLHVPMSVLYSSILALGSLCVLFSVYEVYLMFKKTNKEVTQ